MTTTDGTFKKKHSFEERLIESKRIILKYPDRIPIILEQSKSSGLPELDKQKYLVPRDLTMGQFSYVIRKRIKLPSNKAMFLIVNKKMINTGENIERIYEKNKDEDNFMYVVISGESTFG